MDARQLEYVVAIADHGGFTAAAKALHVSQSALSQSVAGLEAELGVALFDRLGRSVNLTAAGESLLAPARQVIFDLELARAAVDDAASLRRGRLDLVCLPTLAVHPVARLVGELRRRHPGVAVELVQPEGLDDLVRTLRSGASEVGFTELPVRGDGLESFEVGRHEYVAVLPPGRAEEGPSVPVHELADLPLITTPVGTSSRRLLDEAFSGAGLDPTIAVETDHRETIVPLVLAGAGAALLPRPLADQAERDGAIIRKIAPAISRRVGVVWRTGPVSPAARALLGLTGVDEATAPDVATRSRPRPRRR